MIEWHGTLRGLILPLFTQLTYRRLGFIYKLAYPRHDWLDPALGKRSMQLMAEEVIPRVNAAIGKG